MNENKTILKSTKIEGIHFALIFNKMKSNSCSVAICFNATESAAITPENPLTFAFLILLNRNKGFFFIFFPNKIQRKRMRIKLGKKLQPI
ncbi:hypothetical protein RB653_004823 [Dictyostelium firmibasis]|uniref:Uncharacterized protein n=1 Tax=Dictyostelium firmibasis TaxID=79012 RepID=A0AAN7U1N6_9MYCE